MKNSVRTHDHQIIIMTCRLADYTINDAFLVGSVILLDDHAGAPGVAPIGGAVHLDSDSSVTVSI